MGGTRHRPIGLAATLRPGNTSGGPFHEAVCGGNRRSLKAACRGAGGVLAVGRPAPGE
jgi:hypothetical protein